jgi:hypothetical protein
LLTLGRPRPGRVLIILFYSTGTSPAPNPHSGWLNQVGLDIGLTGKEFPAATTAMALKGLFFQKRLCGPLANSRFHHQPDTKHCPSSQLEAAYHRADKAINQILGLLAAATTPISMLKLFCQRIDNPDLSEGPWGRWSIPPHGGA